MDVSSTYTDPAPLWFTPESANVEALEKAWGARKLGQVMGAALGSFNRLGHVDAGTASETFGVDGGGEGASVDGLSGPHAPKRNRRSSVSVRALKPSQTETRKGPFWAPTAG